MYNGIGLQTARGSGTNGYVQRNLSFVKQIKNKVEYRTEDDFKKLEAEVNRAPNEEILAHQRKRMIELKCLEMQELMEEQGYSEEEIKAKLEAYRIVLNEHMDKKDKKKEWLLDSDRSPSSVKETHQMAEKNRDRNQKLKNALGIDANFVEGSSLDIKKAKEGNGKINANLLQRKYTIVKDPSPEIPEVETSKVNESRTKQTKAKPTKVKRHSKRDSSESESDSDSASSYESVKDRKRKRKEVSPNNAKKRHNPKKAKHNNNNKREKRKSAKYSDSGDSDNGSSDSSYSSSSSSSSNSSSNSNSSRNGSSSASASSNNSRYNTKTSRNEHSSKHRHKYSSSPELKRKTLSRKHAKDSPQTLSKKQNFEQKTDLIEHTIKKARLESSRHLNAENSESPQQKTDEPTLALKSYVQSTSSQISNISENKPRVLKSTVYDKNSARNDKEIPKCYSNYNRLSPESASIPSQSSYNKSGTTKLIETHNRSRSSSVNSNESRSLSQRSSSASDYSSRSYSRSKSRTRSRSPSIPRRKGSPSFLDKRRITSARKRPVPYRRSSPAFSSNSSHSYSSRSTYRSRSSSMSIASSCSFKK